MSEKSLTSIEINQTENGYLVFWPPREPGVVKIMGHDMWVFETFDALVNFLKGTISHVHREEP